MSRFISLILVNLATGVAIYFWAWNVGFDLGKADKQNEDIIRGQVTCKYNATRK